MDSILYLSFLVLEENSVLPKETATKLYELCCESLGLVPSPLIFPPQEGSRLQSSIKKRGQ